MVIYGPDVIIYGRHMIIYGPNVVIDGTHDPHTTKSMHTRTYMINVDVYSYLVDI